MNYNDPTQWPPPGPSQPPSPQATLVFVAKSSLAGRRFPLKPAPSVVTLGRDPGCEIVFDPERDRVVGRRHAQISLRPDGIYLTDLDSRNGTFLRGAPVRGTVRIAPGELISLGDDGPQLQVVVELGPTLQPAAVPEHTQVLRPKSRQAAAPPAAPAAQGWGGEPPPNPEARPAPPGWGSPRAPEAQSPLGWPDPRMEPAPNGWRDPRSSGAEWGGAPGAPPPMPAWNAPSSPAQAPAQAGWGQPPAPAPAQAGWGQPPAPAQAGWGQPPAPAPAQAGWGQPPAPAPAQAGWGQPPAPAPAQAGWGQPPAPAPAQAGWGQPPAPAQPAWNAPSSPGAAPQGWGQAAPDGWGRSAEAKGAPPRGGFPEPAARSKPSWDEPGGGFDDTNAFHRLGGLGSLSGVAGAGSGGAESLLRPAGASPGAGPVVGGAAASIPGAPRANPSPLDKLAAFEPPNVSAAAPPPMLMEQPALPGAMPLRSNEPSAVPVGSPPAPTGSPMSAASVAAPALKPRSTRQEVEEEEEEVEEKKKETPAGPKLISWSPDRIAMVQQTVVVFVILLISCGAGFAVAYMNPSPLFAQPVPADGEEVAPE